jgi:hypothetical protein
MRAWVSRLDPFGHLSAPALVQGWLGGLTVLHVLWVLGAAIGGNALDLAVFAALLAGVVVALVSPHPAVKAVVLGVWVGWWTVRFARWPGFHIGVALMMLMSLYVVARLLLAWRRSGTAAVWAGWEYPLSDRLGWPELAGFTKRERRLLLGRAFGRIARPRKLTRRASAWIGVGLAISLLELLLYPPPASEGVALARSGLALLVIFPVLLSHDTRDLEESARRALRDHVLPEFEQQPWLWSAERRAARTGSAR